MTSSFNQFCNNLLRRKTLTSDSLKSDLRKSLSLSDMVFLAIGSMIGSGLYVVTGPIAQNVAGPSVIISYLVAAFASGLSAICYAEFAARMPVTGSAYQFTYLSIGEFWAFIVGWNVLIDHAVTAAAVAKSWSGYLDAVLGNPVRSYMIKHAPMIGGDIIAQYPDFIAAGLLIISTLVLVSGTNISAKFTTVFAGLNLVIVAIIIVTGLYLGNIKNWETVEGGFFPFGFSGTISGAATLIFSYTGYEVIASATEEAQNPNRDVPLSVLIALSVVVVAYVGASSSLTLMVPYYDISVLSSFPDAYVRYGWSWTRYLITIGALASMLTSMFTAIYIVPRYLYAMARDGLLMNFFTHVNEKTKVPLISTLVTGVFCVLFAILFEFSVLIEFIAIGQLLGCTFVSVCVIKLRYQPNCIPRDAVLQRSEHIMNETDDYVGAVTETTRLTGRLESKKQIVLASNPVSPKRCLTSTNMIDEVEDISSTNERSVGALKSEVLSSSFGAFFLPMKQFQDGVLPSYFLYIATLFGSAVVIILLFTHELLLSWWSISLITLFSLISISSLSLLLAFNKDESTRTFKVPGVPFIPFISAMINIILMLNLSTTTWIRLGIWLFIGLIIYFCYGYSHSVEKRNDDEMKRTAVPRR